MKKFYSILACCLMLCACASSDKEDINLPSDILILTPFPIKAVFKTIESRFNTQIQIILNNIYYQNKIIKAYENFIKTKDHRTVSAKPSDDVIYIYPLFVLISRRICRLLEGIFNYTKE